MVLNPTSPIPPCFRKYRRENLVALTPSQHWLFMFPSLQLIAVFQFRFSNFCFRLLSSLKLRCSQHQSRHHSQIHVLYRVIQFRLHHLRVLQLLLQGFHGSRRHLSSQKQGDCTVQNRLRVGLRVAAQQRSHIASRSPHFIPRQSQREIQPA